MENSTTRARLEIGEDSMSSTVTRHTATYTAGGWAVSWLPGRRLDRNAAITAMMLAHLIATTENRMSDNVSFWSSANALAAELGLAGPDAVVRASFGPEDAEPAPALDCPAWCRERHPDADEPHYGPAVDVESLTSSDPYMLTLMQEPGQVAKIVLIATTALRMNEPRDRVFTLEQARHLSAVLLELLAAAEVAS